MCDPQTAWLVERGMKTLAIRWERQCANALALAARLEAHPRIERVHYPGLPSHPHHERAKRQMNSFGAVLAFDVAGGFEAARGVFDRLQLIARAPSLGGVESMALHPATSSHRGLSVEERRVAGIGGGLLRLSVGVEDEADLWDDLRQALES
jgi:methionine-gamma-lyase